MLVRLMIGAMLTLGFGQNVIAGCTCSMPRGGCGRGWNSGQVIFLGKVTRDIQTEALMADDSGEDYSGVKDPQVRTLLQHLRKKPPMNHVVHFSIAESLRGEGQPGQEIVVRTGVDERGPQDGDCSYPFVVGVSYLVYASRLGDSLSTNTCTFTSAEVAVGGVLRELRGVPPDQRTARFVCVLAAARDGKTLATFRGTAEGIILDVPRGANGFGYDPLFYFPQIKKTFAELTAEEKSKCSHRGAAFRHLLEWISTRRTDET